MFTAGTLGKSRNKEGKQQNKTKRLIIKKVVNIEKYVQWGSRLLCLGRVESNKLKRKIPKPQVSATSLSLNVGKVTCSLVKRCPNPIFFTYLSPHGLTTHSLKGQVRYFEHWTLSGLSRMKQSGWHRCWYWSCLLYWAHLGQLLSCFIWHFVNGNRFQTVSVSMGFTKCQIKHDRNGISLWYYIVNFYIDYSI